MAKELVWKMSKDFTGWACKGCGWAKPVPRFVESGDKKVPADIQRDFDSHVCKKYPRKREDVNQVAARIVREATKD
jgi:hypothetical protein